MARPTQELLSRIQKLVSDPRYLNKKHPQHPQVFAEATRAFENAYPEPAPESDTTEGNVHVRAYTRVVDGKEVQVSAYDRTQQIALRGLPLPNTGRREGVEDVKSSNPFHDKTQYELAANLRSQGYRVETDVRVKIIGDGYFQPDLVVIAPDGRRFMIDVKTGAYPEYTDQQEWGYYLAQYEPYKLESADPKLETLGFKQGLALPGFCISVAYRINDFTPGILVSPDVCLEGLKPDHTPGWIR
jgi:hypothetical protein